MDIVTIITVVVSLFVIIGLAEPLAARLRLPYTVILAVLGIMIGVSATFFLRTDLTDALNPVAEAILGLPIRSNVFLYLFLPLVLAGYFILPKKVGARNTWLLLASYAFYAWGNVYYVPLLLGSTAIDFFCAKRIEASDRGRLTCRLAD